MTTTTDLVSMTVALANAASPQVANLNTPLLAFYHTHYPDRVRIYSSSSILTQMVADGFSATGVHYRAAQVAVSQPNAPANIAIGRRANPPLQTLNLACVDGTVNDAYGLTLVGTDGKSHALAYTNVQNPGPAIPAANLTGTATATNGSTTVTFSAAQTLTAGTLLTFSNQTGYSYAVATSTSASTTATLTSPFTGPTASGLTVTPGATTTLTASANVTFSVAQSLSAGTVLTFSLQPGTYYVLSATISSVTAGVLTAAYAGTTGTAQTEAIAPLSGTFGVVNGSPTVATGSSQVGVVYPGDSLMFASAGATTPVTTLQPNVFYTVLSVTATTITLTQNYTGTSNANGRATLVCQAATAALALAAQIAPLSNVGTPSVIASVAPSPNVGESATIQLSRTDGGVTDVQNWASNGFQSIQLTDVTADPGIAADLAAMLAYSSAWYGVTLDSNSAAEIESAVAFVEATGAGGKVGFFNNSDYGNTLTSVTTDLNSVLKLDSYVRSIVQQNNTQLLSFGGISLCSDLLARNPGSYTAGYQNEPGVPGDTPQTMTESQALALNSMTAATPGPGGKNGNWYQQVAGEIFLFPGCAPSGRFFDITLFVDWLQVQIPAACLAVLVGAGSSPGKVPYTQPGLQSLAAAVDRILRLGSSPAYGGIVPDGTNPLFPIVVNVESVNNIDATDINNRNVPPGAITWSAGLTGAIETVKLTGTLVL